LLAAEDELFREEQQATNRHIYQIKIITADETILDCKNAQKCAIATLISWKIVPWA